MLGVIMLLIACPSEPETLEIKPVSFGTIGNASPNKKRLLNYLYDEYGKHIISGQMDTSWTSNSSMDMIQRVYADTGKYPALKGFDFITINDGGADNGKQQTDEAIEWWTGKNNGAALLPGKAGVHGLVAFCWHWRRGGEFYTDRTSFRIPWQNGQLNNTSADFAAITADLDKAAVQLQRLKELDIPVLWRPLHEASGGWFWWGAGGSAAYKALWEYMYDYLVNTKGLNNLVWVWNGQHKDWFPNPATVDIAGYDPYHDERPQDYSSQAAIFARTLEMVPAGNRIIAMTENGAIPDPDECKADNAMWSWFMTWNDRYGSTQGETHQDNFWTGNHHNTAGHKNHVYKHNLVITLDELPDLSAYRQE
jgi:mannan endo-1,4-beta-mannosidase